MENKTSEEKKIIKSEPNKNLSPTAKLLFEMFEQLDCVATIQKEK